jgi:hypothetical protein
MPDAIPQSSESEGPFANMAAVRVGVHEPESHPQQGDFDMGMGWSRFQEPNAMPELRKCNGAEGKSYHR